MKKIKVIAVLCVAALFLSALAGCEAKTPVENAETETEKDYTGVVVADLPLDEQIKIARCVKLSSVVNWGEGAPMYSKEVAEAFLLGRYPEGCFPADFEEHPPFIPRTPSEKRYNLMSFLYQVTHPGNQIYDQWSGLVYDRWAELYTEELTWYVRVILDPEGNVLHTDHFFGEPRA